MIQVPSINLTFERKFEETTESEKERCWEYDNLNYMTCISKLRRHFYYYDGWHIPEIYYKLHSYCGGTCPITGIVDEITELLSIINGSTAGDIIELWTLTEKPEYLRLNLPDKQYKFPLKGSY